MALRFPFLILLLTLGSSSSDGLLSTARRDVNPSSSPKAISDLKEAIVKGLGFQTDGFEISGFDIRDSLVGQSVAYEFHIQVDDKVLPFKLLEDVNRWEYVDERITTQEEEEEKESSNLLMKRSSSDSDGGVLAPFQLAGPMEIWIQDAKHMRLSLPHDVDAGVLKKVILADGAVVTVKGARSVSLRQPLDLPLPLNHTHTGFASGLLTLAHRLRLLASSTSSGDTPLVSVRIVGPTSLTTTTTASSSTNNNKNKLKLKRLAPGLVELSSPSLKTKQITEEKEQDEEPPVSTFLAPDQDQFNKMWPFASVNGSNSNLRGFEALLYTVLGEKANNKGSFRLLKAEASAQTFLKMVFKVEKELKGKGHGHGHGHDDETVSWQGFPEWKTKPEAVKMHFEVLAKVDGDKVVAEKVVQVPDPVVIEDTVAPNLLMGNVTMSSLPLVYPPSSFFTL